jgi:hypothetical protein
MLINETDVRTVHQILIRECGIIVSAGEAWEVAQRLAALVVFLQQVSDDAPVVQSDVDFLKT